MRKRSNYEINWLRLIAAISFAIELGQFYGWNHVADRSSDEVIATGISFLLFSLAFRVKNEVGKESPSEQS